MRILFAPYLSRLFIGAALVCIVTPKSFAAGGSSIIARKGQDVRVRESWPDGVGALVNDAARTRGWNSWFSEWPNDVSQYGFEIASTDDLNRLIKALASIECKVRQIRLSHLKEPQNLGWVTNLPAGNGIAAIFSIGDQSQIDEWYKHVRKPFGVMEFLSAPVAVPPTLTIFVQNRVVDLEKLKVPKGVSISVGYVPTVFHRSNTTNERDREKKAAAQPKPERPQLDAQSQKAADSIEAFLKARQK